LNVDFDGLSLDFLCSRKPAHEGIKEQCPRKNRYFTIVGQSFVKTVADSMGMLPITSSTSDELFQNKGFLLIFAIFGCSAHSNNELRQNSWR